MANFNLLWPKCCSHYQRLLQFQDFGRKFSLHIHISSIMDPINEQCFAFVIFILCYMTIRRRLRGQGKGVFGQGTGCAAVHKLYATLLQEFERNEYKNNLRWVFRISRQMSMCICLPMLTLSVDSVWPISSKVVKVWLHGNRNYFYLLQNRTNFDQVRQSGVYTIKVSKSKSVRVTLSNFDQVNFDSVNITCIHFTCTEWLNFNKQHNHEIHWTYRMTSDREITASYAVISCYCFTVSFCLFVCCYCIFFFFFCCCCFLFVCFVLYFVLFCFVLFFVCLFPSSSSSQEKQCSVKIWTQEWLHRKRLVHASCKKYV